VTSEDVLVEKVASALKLDAEQAQLVVSQSLDRLASKDQVLRDGPTVAFMGSGDTELEEQLTRLARDVLDRMRVRDGVQGTDRDLQATKRVIENVLMSRAWDIGAHYAGGSSGSGMTVSHIGLVALADVMVGLDADARSLARLVWAAPIGDEEKALFDYFVNLGLQRYDEGLSGELHVLAQQSASEVMTQSEAEHVRVFGDTPEDVAKAAAFLDRFENRFYERWSEAIRRREARPE
jgi:hypothetical protein